MKKLFWIFTLLFLLACKNTPVNISPAFYHWQSTLKLTESEQNYIKALAVQKLYIKYFDVDWDASTQEGIPLAVLQAKNHSIEASIQIVPTVFITNRTLKNTSDKKIPKLAENIYKKINKLQLNFPDNEVSEVQIDCDWTGSTQEKYFHLLEILQESFSVQQIELSATIRLHQIKFYEKTKVPPVARGMLMFYNMGNLEDVETENSILHIPTAKQYLVNFDTYPLSLDIALPIFAWGVLLRDGEVLKLINNLTANELLSDNRFQQLKPHLFQLNQNSYFAGHYLYKNDVIRTEQITQEVLQESAHLLQDVLKKEDRTIALYHLDTSTIVHYPDTALQKLYALFRE